MFSTSSPSPVIKTEQEEDMFMSYLNTDYISTDTSDESSSLSVDELSPEQQPIMTLPTMQEEKPAISGYIPCVAPAAASFFWLPQMLSTLSNSVNTSCIPPLSIQQQYHQPQELTTSSPPPAVAAATNIAADNNTASKRRCGGRKRRQEKTSSTPTPPPPSQPAIAPAVRKAGEPALNSEEAAKAAMLAKRQERLIKNRAAALLSRKRKREHVTALEEQNAQLKKENDALKTKVHELTTRVETLQQKHKASSKTTTTTASVMLMLIFFSIAILSLPARTGDRQQTVDRQTATAAELPLIRSASSVPGIAFDRAVKKRKTPSNQK
ncbi:hypothetical protein VTP01DRAFT_1379 [Rhizomucor pusillus]|uniref:uncharacterized protein n=1 Tax=Rhizomucor pusillus TaxID=4840 RepID=UPI003743DFED